MQLGRRFAASAAAGQGDGGSLHDWVLKAGELRLAGHACKERETPSEEWNELERRTVDVWALNMLQMDSELHGQTIQTPKTPEL